MTQIGKYQVVEQVGEGAMGVVYKATDPVLNRTVAVKVMSEGLAQDVALRERFLREAQSAGSLQHPNLVTIYDFGETDGHLFIAMEFIEGVDLEQLMEQKAPMDLAAKLDLMIDVLNGLSYAHRRGIIHRDIKPANIRIDQDGRGRIMDFGVARLETSNLTGTGTMMGTPNYMAPEQISGGPLTPAADLWSVGAVLYEMLTSKKPFQADTLHRVLFKIVTEPPADLLEAAPGLPVGLDHLVKKALEKDPANRYRTASEMANAIAAVRAKMGAPRMSRTISQRSSIADPLRVSQQHATPAIPSRNWFAIGGAVAGLLFLVAAVGYLGRQFGKSGPPPGTVAPTVAVAPADSAAATTTPPQVVTQAPVQAPIVAPAPATPQPNREAPRVAATPPAGTPRQTTVPETKVPARDTQPRVAAIVPTLPAAATQGNPTTQTTSVASPPVSASPPVVPAPVPVTTAPPVVVNPRPAIVSIVEAYAKAIGTREVAEVRRVYPGMTPQQQSQWEAFFSSVRSISANLDISSLEYSGSSAVARLTGAYEFITRAGRSERQPAAFQATFQRDGDRWTLQSVR